MIFNFIKFKTMVDLYDNSGDLLLDKNIVLVPGIGFGKNGQDFVRFSGFANLETITQALENLRFFS